MIYLDNHSTTPVDPRVVEAMAPCWTVDFANASSMHRAGEASAALVNSARESMAALLGVTAREVVFTSGATESNNLAIQGVAERWQKRHGQPGHLLSVATEHKAVLDPIDRLVRNGWRRTLMDVAPQAPGDTPAATPGKLSLDILADAIEPDTAIVSVMLANNETGVLQPLEEIAAVCHERNVLLHCDATQAIGKAPVDLDELGADLVSLTAHKLYGPKGVGALVIRDRRPRIRIAPQLVGGGQELGRRSGTLNVPGIVGFAKALALAVEEMAEESARIRQQRDTFARLLQTALPEMLINGPDLQGPDRLPNNLNCRFPGIDGEALMMQMPEVAVSSGSACTSTDPDPSHVLLAMGLTADEARSSLRFGLGRFTTDQEIEQAAELTVAGVRKLRAL